MLASSASEREMRALRDALDAEDVVTTATSAGDAEQSKPAPDILQIALEHGKVAPEAAIFVGDTVWTCRHARRLGSTASRSSPVGASRAELREVGAVKVYQGPAELLESLQDSLIA